MKNLDELWDEVALTVCRVCIDNSHGVCRQTEEGRCAIRTNFPAVVRAVSSVRADTYGPYVAALREHVCSVCDAQMPGGRCQVRDRVECALDRYYPLVIDAIETAQLSGVGALVAAIR